MTALGLLHGIHGKKPDAVGHIPQVLVARLGNRLDGRSGGRVSHDCGSCFARSTGGRGLSRAPKPVAILLEMVPLVPCARGARNSKPEDSDSFRPTRFYEVVGWWGLRPCPPTERPRRLHGARETERAGRLRAARPRASYPTAHANARAQRRSTSRR